MQWFQVTNPEACEWALVAACSAEQAEVTYREQFARRWRGRKLAGELTINELPALERRRKPFVHGIYD